MNDSFESRFICYYDYSSGILIWIFHYFLFSNSDGENYYIFGSDFWWGALSGDNFKFGS